MSKLSINEKKNIFYINVRFILKKKDENINKMKP